MRPCMLLIVSALVSSPVAFAASPFSHLPYRIVSTSLSPETCAEFLRKEKGALGIPAKAVEREDLPEALKDLWTARLALRDRLAEFQEKGSVNENCISRSRMFLNEARSLEDQLGERLVRPKPFDDDHLPIALSGGFPHVMMNPAASSIDFRSGDIFASRGTAYSSAAISRVSDQPGQFSHLSLLYVDPVTNQKFILQALIEKGVVITPLEKFLQDGKGRLALYRHPDSGLAARVAAALYREVYQSEKEGRHIPYDFSADLKDHSAQFCSELVAWGFELAGVQERLPLHASRISRHNRDFLNDTGLTPHSLFLPSDMDVDSRFTLIAEWRDFSQIVQLRQHDAILDKEYEWMERHDYVFTKEFTMKFMRGLIRGLRRSPFSGLISDWIPDDMPKRALGAVVNLFLASGPIHRELKKADEAELRRSGYRLSDSALRTFLEKLRERDHETFKEVKRWREFDRYNENSQQQPTAVFHDYFRPRNEL